MVANTVTYLWKGYAFDADSDGKILTIPLEGEGASFDLQIPRRIDGPGCPWVVYGIGCGIDPATKAKTGTIVSQVDALTVRIQLASASAVHAWANGWLARAVPGEGSPTYAIVDSTVSASNAVDLILDMPMFPAITVGESVTIYPSCSNTWDTCIAPNPADLFGGAPRKPNANPAFTAIKQSTAAGSKK